MKKQLKATTTHRSHTCKSSSTRQRNTTWLEYSYLCPSCATSLAGSPTPTGRWGQSRNQCAPTGDLSSGMLDRVFINHQMFNMQLHKSSNQVVGFYDDERAERIPSQMCKLTFSWISACLYTSRCGTFSSGVFESSAKKCSATAIEAIQACNHHLHKSCSSEDIPKPKWQKAKANACDTHVCSPSHLHLEEQSNLLGPTLL